MPPPNGPSRLDLRLALPAGVAWLCAALMLGRAVRTTLLVAAVVALTGSVLVLVRRQPALLAVAAAAWCTAGVLTAGALHLRLARPAVLTELAAGQARAQVSLLITGDPVALARAGSGRRSMVRLDARLEFLQARGSTTRLRAPVLVLAPAEGWSRLTPGQRVRATVRLAPASARELLGALVLPRGPPRQVRPAGWVQQRASAVRAGLRRAVTPLPSGPRGLLPGLVIGDTSRLSPGIVAQFRAAGLTHLVAVSGANLAIVVGTVGAVARQLGAGRRLTGLLAALATAAFVVVARPSPSVLRAAVMGLVVLVGIHTGRRGAALPCLAAATLGLLLVDPALAVAPGFALSVLATAGIVLLAAPLAGRAPAWLPRPLATSLAVPVAAQVACAPALVGLFGQLSLVAVPANVLAAPAVPPATLVGALVAVLAGVLPSVAGALAWVAAGPTSWLLLVAASAAALPGALLAWPEGLGGVVLLTAAVGTIAVVLRQRRLRPAVAAVCLAVVATTGTLGEIRPVWPPQAWALLACDVGQGDALAVAGPAHSAIVVDAGPDPAAVDACLRQVRVTRIPLLILTHMHADHVEGVPGVLHRRTVGALEVGPLAEPAAETARVRRWAGGARVPVLTAVDGERRGLGGLSWQVLAPRHAFVGTDSDPNNSSLVLRFQLPGFTALLTGDIEVEAQRELLASGQDVSADVLKVPHHGSARQLPELLRRVGERFALVSVGTNNDYGHPAPSTMALLQATGAHSFRTDRNGPVAFVARSGVVRAVPRRGGAQTAVAAAGRPSAVSSASWQSGTGRRAVSLPEAVGSARLPTEGRATAAGRRSADRVASAAVRPVRMAPADGRARWRARPRAPPRS